MKNYERIVKEAARKRLDKRIPNSTLMHAYLLVKELINNADKEVRILSSKFNEGFYTSLFNEIKNFLSKKDSKLYIITTKENKLLNELKNFFKDKIHIHIISKDKMPKDIKRGKIVNYIVTDTNGYRYEYDDSDIEYGIVEGFANFNNEKEAKYLIKNFKELLKEV